MSQQPAPRQPEFANTPGNEPAVNGGENATTETSETPVEPIEGEFTPE